MWGAIKAFFYYVFYQPIFNLLLLLVFIMPNHDFGLAVIALTVVVKVLMWPLSRKAMASQKALTKLQPKMEELKKTYKDDQEKLAKEMMALYSREKVSPMSSCGLVLIQLPIFISLYRALMHGVENSGMNVIYPFIPNPGTIEPTLLGIMSMSDPSWVLAILAGAAQFWVSRMTVRQQQPPQAGPGGKDENTMAMVNKQMMYMMPVVTVVIGWTMPAALSLYWFIMTLLTGVQTWLMMREVKKETTEVTVK